MAEFNNFITYCTTTHNKQVQESGIKMITIGIDESDNLDLLASTPKNEYSFYVDSFSNFPGYEGRISRQICQGKA